MRTFVKWLGARDRALAVDVWLGLTVIVGAWARFSRIGEFDNQYYTATVASMLGSLHNFVFGSFDPGGVVSVDKPPGAFWLQALSAQLFGVSAWSVNLPQAVAGTLAPVVLYLLMKKEFGRVAAVTAAAVLVVVPASIVIDSRNEPDGLLYFALLLAAVCIVRAAQTGKWRWLIAFSLLAGFAFNVKMLVAFVPLPAFLLYYVLSAKAPSRMLAIRTTATIVLVLAFSFSWATFVALTPADNRPYVGSTQDNSIWTLIFEYNGLNRFGSFAGPRLQPQPGGPGGPSPSPGIQQTPAQLPYLSPYQSPYQAGGTPSGQPSINAQVEDRGVLGLWSNPLAAQLGWLFPLAALSLVVALATLVSEPIYRRPLQVFRVLRDSPAGAQSVLWIGWLVTAAVVFGVANATTTHPYYLVGLAVPMAAVLGMGFGTLWQAFQKASLLAWLTPAALLGGAAYQAFSSQGFVGDLVIALVLVTTLLGCTIASSALWRRLAQTPLALGSVAVAAVALLAIPLMFGLQFGGRLAGAGASVQRVPQAIAAGPDRQRETNITAFLKNGPGAGSAIGTISAREAAPFIIAGVRAVAIGGFSGSDPIFTVTSFRAMAERGDLRYFLMPGGQLPGGPQRRAQQEAIVNDIRTTWQDVSQSAGLPQGTLFGRQSP